MLTAADDNPCKTLTDTDVRGPHMIGRGKQADA